MLYIILCNVCYCMVLYCPVLHCSTLSPSINPFAVNNKIIIITVCVELQFHVLRVQLSPCGIQTYIAYILNNFGSCARVM